MIFKPVLYKYLNIYILFILEISTVNSAVSEATIREATQFCEGAVPRFCVSTTCPQFCNALRSSTRKRTCNAECTADKRCKVKPVVGTDSNDNMALDAQNRDQLWACIAEKRDPAARKTGRRETPWQQLQTPSFKKAIRP